MLAIGIRTVFYARLARDLRELTAAAKRVGDGDLDAPMTVTRSDEIGDLARGFESMQSRLRSDALTGLANRETVVRRINQLIERDRSGADTHAVGVLFVDLDGFKRVNDELGHDAGNRALVDVAARLNHCVRDGDLVARYAGDEFVVMLPGLPDQAAAELVRAKVEVTLREATAAGDGDGARTVRYAGSVGLAVYPGEGDDAAALIKHADDEMYRRKTARRSGGESRFSFRPAAIPSSTLPSPAAPWSRSSASSDRPASTPFITAQLYFASSALTAETSVGCSVPATWRRRRPLTTTS